MMKTRRANLWGVELGNMISQYKEGDIVKPVIVTDHNFFGVVKSVSEKANKVMVSWAGGPISQHDPDELMPVPHINTDLRLSSQRRTRSAEFTKIVAESDKDEDEGVVEASVKVAQPTETVLERVPEEMKLGPMGEGARAPAASMKSRRAMYWCAPDRTFKLTRQEQESGTAVCPKCKAQMELEPFTKSEKLMICPECRFKVPSSKAVTQIEVKVPEGVSVQVTQQDENGEEVQGQNVMARRGTQLFADQPVPGLVAMSISSIAQLIDDNWESVNYAARPYLDAMYSLNNIKDNYIADSGSSIVAYFLANASQFKGPVAKEIKAELKRRLRMIGG